MPRLHVKASRTGIQRVAAHCGWASIGLLMATLLYSLYLNSISRPRDVLVIAGFWAGMALLLFFLYGMGAVLIAAARSPEGRKSLQAGLYSLAIFGILVIANVLAYRRHVQWDLTGNRRLTLAPVTSNLLHSLKQHITVTGFFSSGPQRPEEGQQAQQAKDLLQQYADQSSDVSVHMVDYMAEPDKWATARMTSPPPVTLFTTDTGGREEVKDMSEKAFTGALLKLTRKTHKHIYFTLGHGELSPDAFNNDGASVVKQVLVDEQETVSTLDLMGRDRTVPADCSVLVIAGPRVEFKPEELKEVQTYLDRQGQLLVLLRAGGPDMAALTGPWGINPQANLVIQLVGMGQLTAISQTVRIVHFESHDINRGLSAVRFPLVRSLLLSTKAPPQITTAPVIQSSTDTVARPLALGQTRIDVRPHPGDSHGPFVLAAVAQKGTGVSAARMVVVGATEWAMDTVAQDPSTSNRYLFTNAVNWLAEENDLVDIPPKDTPPDQVTLTPEQRAQTLYLNMFMLPVFCLFMAGWVWFRRR